MKRPTEEQTPQDKIHLCITCGEQQCITRGSVERLKNKVSICAGFRKEGKNINYRERDDKTISFVDELEDGKVKVRILTITTITRTDDYVVPADQLQALKIGLEIGEDHGKAN